jgi:hypothetical protein
MKALHCAESHPPALGKCRHHCQHYQVCASCADSGHCRPQVHVQGLSTRRLQSAKDLQLASSKECDRLHNKLNLSRDSGSSCTQGAFIFGRAGARNS